MYPIDTAKLNIELSSFDKTLSFSIIDGSSCFLTKISKETARELAYSIMDILEEMSDDDHSAQSVLPLNEQREAA